MFSSATAPPLGGRILELQVSLNLFMNYHKMLTLYIRVKSQCKNVENGKGRAQLREAAETAFVEVWGPICTYMVKRMNMAT